MLMKTITNWDVVAQQAAHAALPIVIMVDQNHCPFCRRVESEFFAALFAGGEYEGRALFGKISIDAGENIVVNGQQQSTRQFLREFEAGFTPTILFLDWRKQELHEGMVGMLTPDYYIYYLEQGIQAAIAELAGSAQGRLRT